MRTDLAGGGQCTIDVEQYKLFEWSVGKYRGRHGAEELLFVVDGEGFVLERSWKLRRRHRGQTAELHEFDRLRPITVIAVKSYQSVCLSFLT